MKTNDVSWEEPPGEARRASERAYADAERRRLVYVAATRARDLLVIPRPAWEQDGEVYIHARLLADPKSEWVHAVDPYVEGRGASWSSEAPPVGKLSDANDHELLETWEVARSEACNGRQVPRSVTGLAKSEPTLRIDDTELEHRTPPVRRIARFGPVFGDVVHRAIGLVITRGHEPQRAVERIAAVADLADHHDEAVADVERAVAALRLAGLVGDARAIRLEYPVAAARDGVIVTGYVDFVSASGTEIALIDFKTDQPPSTGTNVVDAFPEYVRQVRTYAEVVGAARAGLLFTGSGRVEWIA